MQIAQNITVNTLIQFLGKLITSGITLLITLLVARELGPDGFGDLTKILAFVALFYAFLDLGFNAIFIRETSLQGNTITQYFNSLLTLRLLFGLVLIFLIFLITFILPHNELLNTGFSPLVKTGIIIYSLTIISQAVIMTVNSVFQKELVYYRSVLATSLGYLLTLTAVIVSVFMGFGILGIIISYDLGALIIIIFSLIFIRKYLDGLKLRINFKIWKDLIVKTLPLAITLVFNLVYFRIDILMLSFLRSAGEVGVYGFAYKFFEVPLVAPTFFMNAAYPVLLLRFQNNSKEFLNLIQKSFLILLTASLFIALTGFVLTPFLINAFGGSDFQGSIPALRILILGMPFFFLSSLTMWILIVLGKQKILALLYGLGAALNIGLNWFFIPRNGYLAAAVTTNITELVVLILSALTVYRFLKRSYK